MRLTMLREAAAHASSVGSAAPSLQVERHAVGLSDPRFDRIITGARLLDGDRIAIPGVTGLLAGAPVDMTTMLAPVEVVDPEGGKSLRPEWIGCAHVTDQLAFPARASACPRSIVAPTGDDLRA